MTGGRGVRWLEARQDRALDAAARRSRVARRIADGGACLTRREWIHELVDHADAIRRTADRYGRAKSRIGVYDPTWGWSDPRGAEDMEDPHAVARFALFERAPQD